MEEARTQPKKRGRRRSRRRRRRRRREEAPRDTSAYYMQTRIVWQVLHLAGHQTHIVEPVRADLIVPVLLRIDVLLTSQLPMGQKDLLLLLLLMVSR